MQTEQKVKHELLESKQPLLLSLLYALSEDLKALHS